MNNCSFSSGNGANKDCITFLGATKGLAVTDPSHYFATLGAAKSKENWRVGIQEKGTYSDLPIFTTVPIDSTEQTAIESKKETTGFGSNRTTGFTPPSMVVNLRSNPCDFSQIVLAGSQLARVWIFDEQGTKMGTKLANGRVKGFLAEVSAVPMSPQGNDAQNMQYKLNVDFQEVDEFKNPVFINDVNTLADLNVLAPVGYAMDITSALSTASMSVKVVKRCTETAATATFTSEILDYYTIANTAPVVTVGALSAGVSVLSIYSTGTTPLAAGEWVKFRLVTKDTLIYNNISNSLIAQL